MQIKQKLLKMTKTQHNKKKKENQNIKNIHKKI